MKLVKLLIFSLILITSFSCQKSTLSKAEVVINDHVLDMGQKLAKKHNLLFNGGGEYYNSWVKKENIHLAFQAFRKLTKGEARQIIVDCIETFDMQTNHNKEVLPYLSEGVYSIDRLNIQIMIQPDNQRTYYPNLGFVSIYKNQITYATYDPEKEDPFRKTEEVETFEVAQHIVQHQHASLRES